MFKATGSYMVLKDSPPKNMKLDDLHSLRKQDSQRIPEKQTQAACSVYHQSCSFKNDCMDQERNLWAWTDRTSLTPWVMYGGVHLFVK